MNRRYWWSSWKGLVLPGALAILGSLLVSDSFAQRASLTPVPPIHEFAFTRFLGRYGTAVAVDDSGFVYVTGRTPEFRNFVTPQSSQKKYGGGQNDAFVAKYSPDGQRLIYATYLGGGDVDMGEDIAVDGSGNAYVAGTTYSRNFPTTDPSAQRRFGGGGRDCFVVKLSADGSRTLYSTLLGGENQDRCTAIAVDGQGNAYVTGSTNSTKFAASNVVNPRKPGKDWDVFAAKLGPEGRSLEYILRFGGTGGREPADGAYGGEFGTGITVDSGGTAYVVGQTDSTDFPIKGSAASPLDSGGRAFVVRINPGGSELLSGAYLPNADSAAAVALDKNGEVYVTGSLADASSQRLPRRGFVTKLTPELNRIAYSSPIPYSPRVNLSASISDIAVDGQGRAHIVGTTQGTDLFARMNPLQKPGTAGSDAFLYILNASGTVILATTIGGRANDSGEGVAVDGSGGIYISGTTLSGDASKFPGGKTLGERSFGAFISKIVPWTKPSSPMRPPIPVEMEFVKIVPGEFKLGCPGGPGPCGSSWDSHRVRITKGFEIGKYEVTQAQWTEVMGTNSSRFRGADLPVEETGWDRIQEFLLRMNARQDGYRYRLPTEAEWEYAARAGSSDKYIGKLDEVAWYWDSAGLETHPVGLLKPNAWGLFDMYGNVRELVQDWYGSFSKQLQVDPVGPSSGAARIARGGSFADDSFRLQAYFRESYSQVSGRSRYDAEGSIGFRCVRERVQ